MAVIELPDPRPEPWRSLLAEFASYEAGVLGFSQGTVGNHGSYLRAFAWWWLRARPSADVVTADRADLSDFLVNEAARGLTAATRRSQVGALRRFFDWLVVTGRMAASPAVGLPTPRVAPPNVDIYSSAEAAAILRHTAGLTGLRGRQRHTIVAMLRYTGMRSGEARTLERCNLDVAAGRARVLGKGSRSRVVVLLPEPLVAILGTFLGEVRGDLSASPLLFVNAHPSVTTPQSGFGQEALAREVELAGMGAGVAGRHYPHRWRHTFATELDMRGVAYPRGATAARSHQHRVDRRLQPPRDR